MEATKYESGVVPKGFINTDYFHTLIGDRKIGLDLLDYLAATDLVGANRVRYYRKSTR